MRYLYTLLLCSLVLTTIPVLAAVKLAPLFADNMVLQRDTKVTVWGTADPGEKVTITVGRRTVKGVAGTDGCWSVKLAPMKATSLPFDVTVVGTDTLVLHNVLVGDVWLCSGQSNMQKPVGLNPPQPPVDNYEQEIATANYPQIRLFNVGLAQALAPQTTCKGQWEVCSPQTVGRFSAAAYFFARQLVQENGIPIGLITSTWGGTPAQMWTSIPTLKQVPTYRGIAELGEALATFAKKDTSIEWRALGALAGEYKQQWWAAHDPGLRPGKEWTATDYDDSAWKTRKEPSNYWQYTGLPDFEGMMWYRKSVEVPAEWNGKDLLFSCSGYTQEASFYFNGVNIDDKRDPKNAVLFTIPAALVKPGKNVLAVRVIGVNGAGGLVGNPDAMYLARADDAKAKIPLAGQWLYQIGLALGLGETFPFTTGLPGTYYNAMIHPLVPYTLKGVLWYQGESDMTGGKHQYYRDVLQALITDWRGVFRRPDLPFLLVQLPNIGNPEPFPTGYAPYSYVREAQLAVALRTPNTALAITIDIGSPDIHPSNKQDVGKRLAMAAQGLVYGKKIEYCGPLFAGMTLEGDKLRLRFLHTGGKLMTRDGAPLTGFAIAGADGKFVLADAVIDGETVLVSSPKVPKPVMVHYAMRNSPVCNLYNAVGLPASPFRSECVETVAVAEKRDK
ncbi:MAG: sialate O-acetylesterase [Armatimonadota bacterium]